MKFVFDLQNYYVLYNFNLLQKVLSKFIHLCLHEFCYEWKITIGLSNRLKFSMGIWAFIFLYILVTVWIVFVVHWRFYIYFLRDDKRSFNRFDVSDGTGNDVLYSRPADRFRNSPHIRHRSCPTSYGTFQSRIPRRFYLDACYIGFHIGDIDYHNSFPAPWTVWIEL